MAHAGLARGEKGLQGKTQDRNFLLLTGTDSGTISGLASRN
jgi:hypothetical protein